VIKWRSQVEQIARFQDARLCKFDQRCLLFPLESKNKGAARPAPVKLVTEEQKKT
jgi:hypothetical protein